MPDEKPKGCLIAIFNALGLSPSHGNEPAQDETLPYERNNELLTAAERLFYGVLVEAVANRHLICPKVRLADLLLIRKGTQRRQKYFNKIQAKHVDFVLADPQTLRPLLAIELDDASHQRRSRQERDTFVEMACDAAGLPILRVPAKAAYNAQDLARSINAAI